MVCGEDGNCRESGDIVCAPYRCGEHTCLTGCTDDDHCVGGFRCDAGSCVRAEMNVVFVTSGTYTPYYDFEGLEEADELCDAAAAAGGLPGTYAAWLSTSTVDARDRLDGFRGWIRPDRKEFADSIADLTSGQVFHPIRLDELGRDVVRDTRVFTGTEPDGTVDGIMHCGNWSSYGGLTAHLGEASGGTGYWTDSTWTSCSADHRIYCFGTDYEAELTPVTS